MRPRLSHAASAAHAAGRSAAAHVAPSVHTHPICAHQAGHGLGHHLRLGRPLLAASHPARLARLQQHFVLRMGEARHTDEALSNAHLSVPILFNRDAEDRSPYRDNCGGRGHRFGIGSATQFFNLHPHGAEKDIKEFFPTAAFVAKDNMRVGVDVDTAAIGHADCGRRLVIGEDLIAGFDCVMLAQKHRRSLTTHQANFPLHSGDLPFYAAGSCPHGQGHQQQDNQNRQREVGPSHISLAFHKGNPMTATGVAQVIDIAGLVFFFLAGFVRFGHTRVPVVHEPPALKFLVNGAALNPEALGRQGPIAPAQP